MAEYLEISVAQAQLEGRVAVIEAVNAERAVSARLALELAAKVEEAYRLLYEARISLLEKAVAAQGVRMALWAGVGSGIAYFIGAFAK